ncbi:MAG: sensor histidine kinase [Pseudomonadota bacterium]
MISIQRRLGASLALIMIGVFLILGIGMSLSFRTLMEGYMLSRLEHDAESLLGALLLQPGIADIDLRAGRMNPVYQRPFSGHYYVISIDGRTWRSRSLWDQTLALPAVAVGETARLRATGPEDQLLLVHVAGFRKAGHDLSIAVAEDLSPIRAEVRKFQLRYGLFGALALALLLVSQRQILKLGLVPLRRTRMEIAEMERGERERLSETVPEEILPVVRQVNGLVATLRQRLSRSRNAMGNLAHALKTPLTLLGQIADRDDVFRDAATAAQMRDQVAVLRKLLDRELKRARLAGAAATGTRLDLRTELEALVAVLRQLYRERDLQLELDLPASLPLAADREDMHELFGNLLDNACKWARSRVCVRHVRSGDGLVIRVEDNGPGRNPEELADLDRRGVRIDEDAVPGHGLGLAIAQDIVQHYGGRLRLGRSADLGGFLAEVELGGVRSEE